MASAFPGHELRPERVHRQLSTVETLRRGRPLPCGTVPAETDPVRPVPEELVHAIRPFLSPQVEAIMLLQLHTGARGGELLGLRPRDIAVDERTGIWFCELDEHKTAHHRKRRTLVFGPQSQAVLEPFMRKRDPEGYLFSPREAEESRLRKATAARRTPLSRGNRVGTNRKPESPRVLGDRYTAASYRRAITRACEKAFPPPEHVVAEGTAAVRAWRTAHAFFGTHVIHTSCDTPPARGSEGSSAPVRRVPPRRDARAFQRLHDHGSPTRPMPNATCNAWPRP